MCTSYRTLLWKSIKKLLVLMSVIMTDINALITHRTSPKRNQAICMYEITRLTLGCFGFWHHFPQCLGGVDFNAPQSKVWNVLVCSAWLFVGLSKFVIKICMTHPHNMSIQSSQRAPCHKNTSKDSNEFGVGHGFWWLKGIVSEQQEFTHQKTNCTQWNSVHVHF